MMNDSAKRFRVAFSFAGEKRAFVAQVAAILAARFGESAVLYDKYHEAEFARRDLGFHLPDLYHNQSDLVVVVVCPDYDPKEWCGLEWDAIFDLLKQRKDEEVMLCRFQRAAVKGLYSTAGFMDLDDKTPDLAAARIVERLALNEGLPKDHYLSDSSTAIISPRTRNPFVHSRSAEVVERQRVRGASRSVNGGGGFEFASVTDKGSIRDLVYISYSHKDKAWHRKLRRTLDADPDLRDLIWDDTKILPGADFARQIDQHVARARVMIMLGSEDYFGPGSGAAQCETRPALEANRNGNMEILWFPVGEFTYRTSAVGHIMAATGAGAAPLDGMSPSEQRKALQRVRQEVRRCLGIVMPKASRSGRIAPTVAAPSRAMGPRGTQPSGQRPEQRTSPRKGRAPSTIGRATLSGESMRTNSKARVFISHSSSDKPFVRKLVKELERHNLNVWFDEQEIQVGDSIVAKVSEGLKDPDYLIVVLSKASAASRWVQEELNAALMDQISGKGTVVLPVLVEDSDIPPLLRTRLYADFRGDFDAGMKKLLAVLEQETAPAFQATRGVVRSFAAPCATALSALSLADLRRRMTKRMSRSDVGMIWFDVFETQMDDDMANRPLVDCVIELLDRAKRRDQLSKIIDELCAERADLANP